MIDIIPGSFEQDFSAIEERLQSVEGVVDWAQIDIADETLVPAKSLLEFEKFGELAKKISLEAHLMVANPEKYIRPLVDAGFRRLIAHVECNDPRLFLDAAKYESVEVGLAVDGATEIEQIEPFLEEIDVVLVMTVEAGASGEPFLPETVEKIRLIHQNLPNLPIEVDGGINDQTVKLVKDAGATRAVSTSYIFKDPKRVAEAIEHLQNA